MGAIAEAIVAYAQPLIDQTDGSLEQMKKAFALSQLCYNLALMPQDSRDQTLCEMQSSLQMDDKEFDDFRRSVVIPMIQRHEEMFPRMHMRSPISRSPGVTSPDAFSLRSSTRAGARSEAYPGTDRYAPCPCNSGRKYKFCCGKPSPR